MYDSNFQKRIQYQGSPEVIFRQVCSDYQLGDYRSGTVVPVGYEDYNVIVITTKGKYFVKFFSSFRSKEDCRRYIDIMVKVLKTGVKHPKLYESKQGFLHEMTFEKATVWLCVLEFVEGKSFYSLQEQPTKEELMFLMRQAALINQMDVQPSYVYDSWACVNFLKEFEKNKQYLSQEDIAMVEPLSKVFHQYNLEKLPHCFVHGDITKTNVMRSDNGELYVLDFSVANWYPRVQELSVLFCDLFFNERDPSNFSVLYDQGLTEYQKVNRLTDEEVKILPLYTKVAYAMNIVCPIHEREVNKNYSKENDQWLELGRNGLRHALSL